MDKNKRKVKKFQATNHQSAPDEIKNALRYASPKQRKKFFIDILKSRLTHTKSLVFDQDRINTCISAIESGNRSRYPYFKYGVIYEDGKKLLIIKRKDKFNDPIIQVLPKYELFNVISDIFTIHPDIDYNDLIAVLTTRYKLPFIHQRNYQTVLRKYTTFSSMQCGIITIGEKPDNDYNFVLICVDSASNYVYLRPLMTKNHNEIAIEFLKVLLDVGIPNYLEVNIVNLFQSVFNYLSKTFTFITPPEIIYKNKMCKLIHCAKKLLKEIKIWLQLTKSSNWAIGLGYVQWLINTKSSITEKPSSLCPSNVFMMSPYHAHFSVRPKLASIISKSEEYQENCTYTEQLCVVCDANAFTGITCDVCNRFVHSTCATKVLLKCEETNIIEVKCLSCGFNN